MPLLLENSKQVKIRPHTKIGEYRNSSGAMNQVHGVVVIILVVTPKVHTQYL